MFDLAIRNGVIVDGTGADAFPGEVAVQDGRIAEVGERVGPARRDLDAAGRTVMPGFVDAHTHYDGQVTWDPELSPSSWHGVTTVVMGNCGVGFAPARPDEREFLIRVMEGVEEIPGAALEAGMSWDWESFPGYLDALDRRERSIDVVAQVPHCALRCYVMGQERALDDEARDDDIEQMTRLTHEALEAGALGFSTSRTFLHRVKDGPLVPGTHSRPEELVGIARALGRVGHGVFQMISDRMGKAPDIHWMKQIARSTGRPLVFSMVQASHAPREYREVLEALQKSWEEEGLDIRAGVSWRPPGVLMGLQATLNPFTSHPTYRELRHLPLDERVRAMRRPEVREKILSEKPATRYELQRHVFTAWHNQFVLGDPPEYEPEASASLEARARAQGVSPQALAYDTLLQNGGREFLYYPLQSYADYDFGALHEMLSHPRSTASLSDGGAHVGTVCDASFSTYMLTHWTRDRQRGPRFRVEQAVRKQTSETASLYGLEDRGVLAPGRKADLNVVDTDALHLHAPYMAFDLPEGGKRLLQKADGYAYTLVAGEVVAEHGEMTDARPGRLVRGPQH